MQRGLRADIQVMRGLAVLAVILFHANERYFPNGYLGVDVFFVISGFVITPKLCQVFSNFDKADFRLLDGLKSFFVRRFWRLVPALLVTITWAGLLLFFLAPYEDQQRLGMQGLATIFVLGNFGAYKYSGNYFTPNPNPLVHTWSLSIEEQIYIFIPLAMALWMMVFKRNARALFSLLAILSLFLFLFPSFESKLYQQVGFSLDGFSFYSPLARLWQFLIGGLLYLSFDQNINRAIKRRTLIFVFPAIILLFVSTLFFFFFSTTQDRKIMSILTAIATCLAIHFRCFLFSNKVFFVFERLGNQSYSTYLIHMPLLYLARFSPFFGSGDYDREIPIVISVFLALTLGNLSFVNIEQRYRFNIDAKQVRKTFIRIAFISYFFVFTTIIYSIQLNLMADPKYGRSSSISSMQWYSQCDFIEPKEPVCELGSKYSRRILLIGDSHAASVSKVLAEIGENNQLSIAIGTKGSCPFILEEVVLDDLAKECIEHNHSIREFVKTREISAIVYFQRRFSSKYENQNLNKIKREFLQTSYAQRILNSLATLDIDREKILVMGFIPEATSEPTRLGYLLGERSNFVKQTTKDNISWERMVGESGFTYIDTFKAICKIDKCPVKTVDNQWILEDWQHLSIAGADLLKQIIFDNLNKI